MNKAELVKAVEERLQSDRKTAANAVDNVIDLIVRQVAKGEKVSITGFGVFEKRRRGARMARNPATGASVKVKATSVPAFRPGTQFKEVVSGAKKLERVSKTAAASSGGRKTATKAAKSTKSATAKSTTRPATKSTAKSTAKSTKSSTRPAAKSTKSTTKATSTGRGAAKTTKATGSRATAKTAAKTSSRSTGTTKSTRGTGSTKRTSAAAKKTGSTSKRATKRAR